MRIRVKHWAVLKSVFSTLNLTLDLTVLLSPPKSDDYVWNYGSTHAQFVSILSSLANKTADKNAGNILDDIENTEVVGHLELCPEIFVS